MPRFLSIRMRRANPKISETGDPFAFQMRNQDMENIKKKVFENQDSPIRKLMDCCYNVSNGENKKYDMFKASLEYNNPLYKVDLLMGINSIDFGKLRYLLEMDLEY